MTQQLSILSADTLLKPSRRPRRWAATGVLTLLAACGGSGTEPVEADDVPIGSQVMAPVAGTTAALPAATAPSATPAPAATVATQPAMPAAPTGQRATINSALIPSAKSGSSTADIASTGELPYKDRGGIGAFRNVCQFSHMNFDDALVFPGRQGATHLHTYFGNTSARFDSTAESLAANGASTCRGGVVNRSAYWVPTMIDTRDGRPLAPQYIDVYYKTGYGGVKDADVRAWPLGFRMIAGNASGTGPQPGVVSYRCGGGASQASIPNCTGTMTMSVTFAQCWDGTNLSSPDYKSHVAYPTGRGCPSSHPVATPELSIHVHYATTFGNSSTWRLSSDLNGAPAGSSGHADWVHAWDTSVMDTWVRQVVNRGLSGGSHILGDGRVVTCKFAGCR